MLDNKYLRRTLWVIEPVIGTAIAILTAMTGAVGTLVNVAGWSEDEINQAMEIEDPAWYVRFNWNYAQNDFITRNCIIIGLLALLFAAVLVLLCIMNVRASRNEDGSVSLNRFDRIWSEILIIAMCFAAGGAIGLAVPVYVLTPHSDWINIYTHITPLTDLDAYYFGANNNVLLALCIAGIAVCITAAVICFVSVVKKICARQLIEKSLLGIILGWLGIGATAAGKGAVKAGSAARSSIRKLTVPADDDQRAERKIKWKYILIAYALIFLPFFMFMATKGSISALLTLIICLIIAARLISSKIRRLNEIRRGVIEVRSGNLTYKIPVTEDENGPVTDLDKLAADINNISEATNIAVQNEIKNQRMKTDLISNVSHDLKTPLTSMISYLDILEKEGLDSPDAPAHLAIVKEKTERLKTLTEELFEAAKASSGNIPCEITDIDIAAMIDQILAEMDDKLKPKKLKIKKSIKTENTLVRADGNLLSRVLENLLGNISKYALEKSRVYIDVTDAPGGKSGRTLIEIKNISKAELNISADELMERFTRGDSSRNTEGSGLGLAIAKDLTTLMGGVFEISIDGDMFKASILLDKA